jgi:hypothetical protein
MCMTTAALKVVPVVTQQSAIISAKVTDPKKVTWDDTKAGDWPSTKAGENGQMVKSISTICGIDAKTFST